MTAMPVLRPRQGEQGFSLTEALAGILILGIAAAGVGGPLVIGIATRIQNQRIERAGQLAQLELDRVRALASRGDISACDLIGTAANATNTCSGPALNLLPRSAGNVDPGTVGPPTGPATGKATLPDGRPACIEPSGSNRGFRPPNTPTTWCAVDSDGDGIADFALQTFRTFTETFELGGFNYPITFQVGIRVFNIEAMDDTSDLTVTPAKGGLTGALGQQLTNPLAVIYSEVSLPDVPGRSGRVSLAELCNSINARKGTSGTCITP